MKHKYAVLPVASVTENLINASLSTQAGLRLSVDETQALLKLPVPLPPEFSAIETITLGEALDLMSTDEWTLKN